MTFFIIIEIIIEVAADLNYKDERKNIQWTEKEIEREWNRL